MACAMTLYFDFALDCDLTFCFWLSYKILKSFVLYFYLVLSTILFHKTLAESWILESSSHVVCDILLHSTWWHPCHVLLVVYNIFLCKTYICGSDTYNPVPGVMVGVPASKNYDGGFASKLMVWFLLTLQFINDLHLLMGSCCELEIPCCAVTAIRSKFAPEYNMTNSSSEYSHQLHWLNNWIICLSFFFVISLWQTASFWRQ